VEEGAEIQTKGIENLFNDITEKISHICVTTQTLIYRKHFKLQIDMISKNNPEIHSN
jgi:hypothetical protein